MAFPEVCACSNRHRAYLRHTHTLSFLLTGIPGYPYWMWKVTYQQSLPMLKKYRENSLPVNSEEMKRIRRAARDNQM